MNDILKSKLEILNNDEDFLNAIRAVIDERIEKEKPKVGESDDNLLGQKYRAYEQAKVLLDKGFNDIKDYQRGSKKVKTFDKEK